MTEMTEGWSPTTSKWHYFGPDGRSLCGKWGFNRMPREQGDDDSPDNCAECRRRLIKRRAAAQS
jgi:hypothetical protein